MLFTYLLNVVLCSCVVMAVYGSQSSIPNYYNDAPDRPLFGESRPRVSETIFSITSQVSHVCLLFQSIVDEANYCEKSYII